MKTKVSSEVFDEYLKICLFGGNPYNEIVELLTAMKGLIDKHQKNKVLIDAVNMGVPSEIEKFQIGEMGIDIFGSKIKVAIFTRPEYINKFFENVVVNRGGRVYVAGSEEEALDWLLK